MRKLMIRNFLDEELRKKVVSSFERMHQLYDKQHTPKVKTSKSCKCCSLAQLCIPQLNHNKSVADYFMQFMKEEEL